jgi:hypothetical protein
MFALLAATVMLAQSSVTIGIGNKPKQTDSVRVEQERRQDSLRLRREIRRDSVIAAIKKGDSVERARRRARQIALTPALLANAFKDPGARALLAAARKARLEQDSSIIGYDATAYERMSVGLGFKKIGRDRLLMRAERATRVVWSRGAPVYAEVLGKRQAMPMLGKMGDADIDMDDAPPIPYYPGRETLFVGSGLAKADIDESDFIHPLAHGSEAYYTYATGDSVSFQLPGGQRINIRELVVRPRAPKWNVALGSLWFDVSSARLVRAVFRMADPMDIWAVADEEADAEDHDDPPPKWVKGLISPLKAEISAVTVEYGLHEGKFWMPRLQSLEGSAQAGFMHVPFKMEQSFKYASVNGATPVALPQIAAIDTATDSVSRKARIARRRSECKTGGVMTRTQRSFDSGMLTVIHVPCDTVALAKSPELPKSIYDEGEELFGEKERDELISQALTLGAQPGWVPQKPVYTYGLGMTRYNKIEGLSSGIGARASLGNGYTAHGQARIGIADWQPNGELGLSRSNGRSTYSLNAYRRLSAANDWNDPFAFGSSLSALLFGRDEGFYYRNAGIELTGTPDDSASMSWRLFAENHSDARKKTNFSLAHSFGADGFTDNIDTDNGNIVGLAVERHGSYGLDPHGFRFFGSVRGEGATGSFDYGRAMFDATVSRGITPRLDGALTLGAGTSAGKLPAQRLWYLGGSQTVRGQEAGTYFGDAFWMGRVELGSSFVGARPVVFYDVGWAGDRRDFGDPGKPMSGAGVGASFMDGLVRFDLARGIYPQKKVRASLYVEARF